MHPEYVPGTAVEGALDRIATVTRNLALVHDGYLISDLRSLHQQVGFVPRIGRRSQIVLSHQTTRSTCDANWKYCCHEGRPGGLTLPYYCHPVTMNIVSIRTSH